MHNKIRELREQQGISQHELAKMSGLSVAYICLLENNLRNNPSYKTLVKISKALNRNVDEVFDIGHSNHVGWNLKEKLTDNKLLEQKGKIR